MVDYGSNTGQNATYTRQAILSATFRLFGAINKSTQRTQGSGW